jgi:hypothetical protein
MPLSSTNRALIAIAVIIGLGAFGAGVYLYRHHRPLSGSNAGAAPDLLNQLPVDAPAIAYIDVAALRGLQNSPLAAVLGLTSAGPQADREYTEFVHATGFDYSRDLDKAAIAAWPQSLIPPSGGAGENPILTIADGRFNEEKIKAYALRTGKMVARGAQSVYEVPGNPPLSFTFLSPTRIVLASGKSASDQLAKVGGATTRDPGTQARIARVAGAPIFAVVRTDQLPASFYSSFGNSSQLERLARSVRGMTLAGQPDGEKIKIALDAECDSISNALQLATLLDFLRMGSSMALSDPKTRRQMNQEQAAFLHAVVDQMKVAHQDKWVRLTLDVTPEMLGARPPSASDPPSSRHSPAPAQ